MTSECDFSSLGLDARLVEGLTHQNITKPTQIQQLAIPRILRGESLAVRSQTGSGKSLAYLLPLVQLLSSDGGVGARLLILVPTRELAQQVGRVCRSLSGDVGVAVIYGGVDYELQREALSSEPEIIVATPGRLEDLIGQGAVDLLGKVSYFVLDEVDQMVDMGFREPISNLVKLRGEGAQSLCFSATLPEGVAEVVSEVVGEVDLIEDRSQPLAAQRIDQSCYFVEQSMMDHLLLHLLRTKLPTRSIIFSRSRKMADRISKMLRENDFAAEAIHSDRSQAAREYILGRFCSGETTILVATDLMARGIDVEGVTHIFNFGLPLSPDQYVHRIGRTGRAGASGEAITLLCVDEKKLLDSTCATMRQRVIVESSHPYMTPAVTRALSEVEEEARLKTRRKARAQRARK